VEYAQRSAIDRSRVDTSPTLSVPPVDLPVPTSVAAPTPTESESEAPAVPVPAPTDSAGDLQKFTGSIGAPIDPVTREPLPDSLHAARLADNPR
jgi:hypothetical protein